MNTIKSTDTLVALDIGTSKVLCLVADIDDKGELRIIGIGNEPCAGLNKGVISEIDATVSSVRRAKEKASSMSSFLMKLSSHMFILAASFLFS